MLPSGHTLSSAPASLIRRYRLPVLCFAMGLLYLFVSTQMCMPSSMGSHSLSGFGSQSQAAGAWSSRPGQRPARSAATDRSSRSIREWFGAAAELRSADDDGSGNSASSSDPSLEIDTPHDPADDEEIRFQNLLPWARSKGDSSGQLVTLKRRSFDPDPPQGEIFNYELCSFTHACADSTGIRLFIAEENEYNRVHNLLASCFDSGRFQPPPGLYGPCHCFYPAFKVSLLPFYRKPGSAQERPGVKGNDSAAFRSQTSVDPLRHEEPGHFFSVHKYVRVHHIAHWAQKILLMQSVLQHRAALDAATVGLGDSGSLVQYSYDPVSLTHTTESFYPASAPRYGPLSGMVFHDLDLPLSAHEQFILETALHSVADAQEGVQGQGQGQGEDASLLRDFARRIHNTPLTYAGSALPLLDQHAPKPPPPLLDAQGNRIWNESAPPWPPAYDPPQSIMDDRRWVFAQPIDRASKEFDAWAWGEARRLQRLQLGQSDPSDQQPDPDSAPSMRCFERLSFTRAFGVLSTSAPDTTRFRAHAYKALGGLYPKMLSRRCPPRRVVMLYRANRGIRNWEAIGQIVGEITGHPMERLTVNAYSSPREQAELFASTGQSTRLSAQAVEENRRKREGKEASR